MPFMDEPLKAPDVLTDKNLRGEISDLSCERPHFNHGQVTYPFGREAQKLPRVLSENGKAVVSRLRG